VAGSDSDVVVIGAGVVGCAVAFELASAGHRVTVLDMRRPGAGASRASAGILAPYVEGHHSAALKALGLHSLERYESFVGRVVKRSGVAVEFRHAGTLELAVTSDDAARLTRSGATLTQAGVAAEWMDGDHARALEPTLGSHVLGALRIPSHAIVNVPALTAAAATAARALGATFHDGVAGTGIDRGSQGRLVVHSSSGDFHAAHVVLASGSWSAALAPPGAVAPPVTPIRGQLLHVKTPPGTVRHILWGHEVYLVPWNDGMVYIGATSEDVGFDERTTVAGVAGLLAATQALAPGLADAAFVEARAGLRPGTEDSLPFIGPSEVLPGLVYACGHYRNGALLAPITAALVADVLRGDRSHPALALSAPSRAGRL
jgi:glycine oxidase